MDPDKNFYNEAKITKTALIFFFIRLVKWSWIAVKNWQCSRKLSVTKNVNNKQLPPKLTFFQIKNIYSVPKIYFIS